MAANMYRVGGMYTTVGLLLDRSTNICASPGCAAALKPRFGL